LNETEFEEYKLIPKLLRTDEAKKVYFLMKEGTIKAAIERVRAYFIVMGPGKSQEGYESRLMIKKLIEEEKKQVATFPEDVSAEYLRDFLVSIGMDVSYLKNLVVNPATKEYVLMLGYDMTVILLMSAGAISEYSMYFTKRDVAHKIRVYYPRKFSKDPSFIRLGPLELFSRVHRHVYIFKNDKELKKKVGEMVDNYLTYLLLSSY